MTGQSTIPDFNDGGYSVGGFISDLNPGKIYAMYYPETQNYVKIEIISHSPGNILTIVYSIKVNGGVF